MFQKALNLNDKEQPAYKAAVVEEKKRAADS
jgi:hypothetical protein